MYNFAARTDSYLEITLTKQRKQSLWMIPQKSESEKKENQDNHPLNPGGLLHTVLISEGLICFEF